MARFEYCKFSTTRNFRHLKIKHIKHWHGHWFWIEQVSTKISCPIIWGKIWSSIQFEPKLTNLYHTYFFEFYFSGPLFNLLLGIGLPFTIQLVKNGGKPITFDNSTNSKMVQVLSASLGVALIVSFILFPVTKFKATKVHGCILVVLYIILLTASIVIEFS